LAQQITIYNTRQVCAHIHRMYSNVLYCVLNHWFYDEFYGSCDSESEDLLCPINSVRCSGSFSIDLVSENEWHSIIACLTVRPMPHDTHVGDSFLLIRWRWVIFVCPINSSSLRTSNFLGRSVEYVHMNISFLNPWSFAQTNLELSWNILD